MWIILCSWLKTILKRRSGCFTTSFLFYFAKACDRPESSHALIIILIFNHMIKLHELLITCVFWLLNINQHRWGGSVWFSQTPTRQQREKQKQEKETVLTNKRPVFTIIYASDREGRNSWLVWFLPDSHHWGQSTTQTCFCSRVNSN